MTTRLTTYAAFWPFYLGEHRKAATRRLHLAGTSLGLLLLIVGVLRADWRLIVTALVLGYAPAWVGHFFVEKNRPATFKHPLWSLVSDLRMLALFLAGRLEAEYRKYGIG